MISAGMASPRRWRTAASVAISLIVMASKSAVASIRPDGDGRDRLGDGVDADHQRPLLGAGPRVERIEHAERHGVVGAQHRVDALPLIARGREDVARDVALVFAGQRQPHLDAGMIGQRILKALQPLRGWWRTPACLRR